MIYQINTMGMNSITVTYVAYVFIFNVDVIDDLISDYVESATLLAEYMYEGHENTDRGKVE